MVWSDDKSHEESSSRWLSGLSCSIDELTILDRAFRYHIKCWKLAEEETGTIGTRRRLQQQAMSYIALTCKAFELHVPYATMTWLRCSVMPSDYLWSTDGRMDTRAQLQSIATGALNKKQVSCQSCCSRSQGTQERWGFLRKNMVFLGQESK